MLQPLLEAAHGLREPRLIDRLQKVIERTLREGLDRVVIVRGDEYEMRAAADVVRRIDAGETRHVDVEEADVGMPLVEQLAPPPARSAPRPRPRARARRPPAGAAAPLAAAVHRRRSGLSPGRSCPLCRQVDFDGDAARCTGCEAQLRRVAADQLQPLAQSREAGPETVPSLVKSRAGVGHAGPAAVSTARRMSMSIRPPSLGRVDPVPHGILDQRQQGHRRTPNLQRRRIHVDRVLRRSGMRICMSSR